MAYLIAFGVLVLLFIIYGYSSNYACKVTRQTIFLQSGLEDKIPLKFAVISDLHGQSFGKKNEALIRKIDENQPDAVLIPGDMIVKNGAGMEVCFSLLENLVKKYPIYYSSGNHELCLKEREEFRNRVKALGVHFLENESIIFQKKGQSMKIFGLSLPEEFYRKFWCKVKLEQEMMEGYVGESGGENINLLLAHNPDYFEEYEKWGADIVVSGHLHGGIMSLWFGGVIAPSLRPFPRYSKGYYRKNKTHLYVSRGLGLHHIKLRFFNPPELVILTLDYK